MATWLEDINVLELSAVRRPANRKRKLLQKAEWSAAFINDLPDASFLYIAPGGSKDDQGKTTPRSLRYFPVRDAAGRVDLPHLRNALSRIPQAKLPASVKDAARAKAQRLLDQINKSTQEDEMPPLWIPDETATELLEKGNMPDLQKQAIKAAIAALNGAKAEMEPEMFKAARAAMAKLLGFGAAQKSVDDAEAKVEAEQQKHAKAVEVVKSAVETLQTDKPSINDVVSQLADLVGVTPTFKRLEQLPPELKAEWEALQKSRDDDRKALAEMRKTLDEQATAAERREFVTKAATMDSIPLGTDALGQLLHVIAKTEDKDAIAALDQLLGSVQEIAKQSALFVEQGGGGPMPAGQSGAFGKIEGLAQELITKSERPLTKEQAVAQVLEANPRLYDQWCKGA